MLIAWEESAGPRAFKSPFWKNRPLFQNDQVLTCVFMRQVPSKQFSLCFLSNTPSSTETVCEDLAANVNRQEFMNLLNRH